MPDPGPLNIGHFFTKDSFDTPNVSFSEQPRWPDFVIFIGSQLTEVTACMTV